MALSRGKFGAKGRRGRGKNQDTVKVMAGSIGALLLLLMAASFLHTSSSPVDAGLQSEVALAPVKSTDILVPIETLPVGSAFQPIMFRKDSRPEDQITPDIIRSFDDLKGKYAKAALIRNQPISKGALTDRQPVHVLTAMLPKGYRAVALEVGNPLVDNVDGWAQPGTDVDLVWITRVFGKESVTVLAGPVKILAANKATAGSVGTNQAANNFATVTLLLSLRDAMRVSLASMNGKISLGLRGEDDKRPNQSSVPISSVNEEIAPATPKKAQISVRVAPRSGGGAEVRQYDESGRRVEE